MLCDNNDIRCHHQGYCDCYQDSTSKSAAGCGGLFIIIIVGIVAAFLYPAIRINRSSFEYETNGSLKFAGTKWLFLSPLFGLLSNTLYQTVFAAGACAADALYSRATGSIYKIGMFAIYILAIGLALITFLFRNRTTIKLFVTEHKTRTVKKGLILAGVVVTALLVVCAAVGIVSVAATDYYLRQADDIQASSGSQRQISSETAKYDSYAGKYKLTGRNDGNLFRVAKSDDGKNLSLSVIVVKDGGTNANAGCLLSPVVEENSIYYAVSNCVVNGKLSQLSIVRFKSERNKTTMNFIYDVRTSGDTLEKIK